MFGGKETIEINDESDEVVVQGTKIRETQPFSPPIHISNNPEFRLHLHEPDDQIVDLRRRSCHQQRPIS